MSRTIEEARDYLIKYYRKSDTKNAIRSLRSDEKTYRTWANDPFMKANSAENHNMVEGARLALIHYCDADYVLQLPAHGATVQTINWDEQLKALLSNKTPIYVQETPSKVDEDPPF